MPSRTPAHAAPLYDPFHWSADIDVLAIQQYREQWQGAGYLQSEKRLMFAVLLDAIECFQKYGSLPGPHARRLFENAEDWIFQNNRDWPFSFINVCEALEIDPGYLRKGLLEWRQRSIRPPAANAGARPKLEAPPHKPATLALRSLF